MWADLSAELVVVGAGPAGLAAAVAASECGVDCLVLDEQPEIGGRIFTGLEAGPVVDKSVFGSDYTGGRSLLGSFRRSRARHLPSTSVWGISPGGLLHLSDGQRSFRVRAGRILAATGAQERPFPIRGWTLPGVLMAGGAQLLFKRAGLVPSGPVVLAGTGPLLVLLAAQYLAAGVEIAAILDTTDRRRLAPAAARLPAAVMSGPLVRKGLALLRRIRSAGVKVISGVDGLAACGEGRLEAVRYRAGRREGILRTSLLLLHQGIVPDTRIVRLMRGNLGWEALGRHWVAVTDEWGATSVANLAVAGDGRCIVGAAAAAHEGRLAGLDAAMRLGKIDRDRRNELARPSRRALVRSGRERRFLDTLFAPAERFLSPADDDVIVCRCEDRHAGVLREAIENGIVDPNRLKSLLRAGMGPCQARFCEPTLTELVARHAGRSPDGVAPLRIRPPLKPVPVEEFIGVACDSPPPESRIVIEPPARTIGHHAQ